MRIGISGNGMMAREVEKVINERIAAGDSLELAGIYFPRGSLTMSETFGGGENVPDVIIDFSNPANIDNLCRIAEEYGCALVIATTGFSEEERSRIALTGMSVPVVLSSNFSLGINVISRIVSEIADVLGDDFDIEIVEKHHRRKVDSPSGTALLLADSVNREGRYDFTYGRFGSSKRRPLEIGIHAVRGGGITGEHSVIFAGDDEVLEISHSAGSRRLFAQGAVRASIFAGKSKPGMYSMQDVLFGKN